MSWNYRPETIETLRARQAIVWGQICADKKALAIIHSSVSISVLLPQWHERPSGRGVTQRVACMGRTRETPAGERPTLSRRGVGVATATRNARDVTGNSARADGLRPSLALGLNCTEAATNRSGEPQTGHPAVAMTGATA